jgi:uncharacterized membrane protein
MQAVTALRRAPTRLRWPHLVLASLVAAYAVRFALLSVQVYRGYGDPPYDLAIFDQGVWLLSRFHAPFVTVMGRDLFGDHTSFILLLVVPLYWVYPHVVALLVLQACLLAAAAVPVYLLAAPRLGEPAALVLAAAFLLNPSLQNGNLEQFHPEAFLVLALATALYAAAESRPRLLAVAVVACLLVKEDTGLLIAPLGVWVALRRNRTWGLRLVAAGVLWTVFATEVVIMTILGTASFYANRIPFGGIGGLVRTVVDRPATFVSYVRSQGRLFYLWQTVFPVGVVFVRAPSLALVGILTVTLNVVSDFGYMHQILYHYSMSLVPVVVMGAVWGLAAMRPGRGRTAAVAAVGVCALWSCTLWGLAPWSRQHYPHLPDGSREVADISAVLARVPAHAVVSAYYPYVAHIDHRTRIYMWPTPFAALDWGLYTHEGQRLPFAGQVQWLVLPTGLDASDAATFATVAPHFKAVYRRGDVVLYHRR